MGYYTRSNKEDKLKSRSRLRAAQVNRYVGNTAQHTKCHAVNNSNNKMHTHPHRGYYISTGTVSGRYLYFQPMLFEGFPDDTLSSYDYEYITDADRSWNREFTKVNSGWSQRVYYIYLRMGTTGSDNVGKKLFAGVYRPNKYGMPGDCLACRYIQPSSWGNYSNINIQLINFAAPLIQYQNRSDVEAGDLGYPQGYVAQGYGLNETTNDRNFTLNQWRGPKIGSGTGVHYHNTVDGVTEDGQEGGLGEHDSTHLYAPFYWIALGCDQGDHASNNNISTFRTYTSYRGRTDFTTNILPASRLQESNGNMDQLMFDRQLSDGTFCRMDVPTFDPESSYFINPVQGDATPFKHRWNSNHSNYKMFFAARTGESGNAYR